MELRVTALIPLTAALIVAPLLGTPIAQGDPAPNWSGNYKVTFHTDQKSGSSMAATQSEEPYSATYQFSTDCSSGSCVASAIDGPTPKDNVSKAVKFDWTGSQWSRTNNWRWDCLLPDRTITYDPATSVTTYLPQADGSLTGTFQNHHQLGCLPGHGDDSVTAVPV